MRCPSSEEHGSVKCDFVALDGHDVGFRSGYVGIRPKETFSAHRTAFPGLPGGGVCRSR